jgi:TonB family protein
MRKLAVALIGIYLVSPALPQQPNPNSPEPISKVAPVYPPIARAAHVSGTVAIDLTIDKTGHVRAAKAVSGPPMLVGAALDSVKQWVYKPFLEDGKATEKTVRTYVNFNMPPPANPDDQEIGKRYFPAFEACQNALRDPDTKSAAASCSASAEIAATFSDQERFIERRSAYVYAASANLRDKQFDHALFYAEKAVTVVLQGHDDGSGSNAAYSVRAQAEAAIGNLTGADADLTTAENFERKAIQNLVKDAPQLVEHEYTPTLKNQLLFHARVLDALKNPSEADAKRQEAAKL